MEYKYKVSVCSNNVGLELELGFSFLVYIDLLF